MALKGTKALLVWSQRCTEGYKNVSVNNMTKSWRDGLAFCAIIHHFRPDLIDFFSLSKENVYENCNLAFEVAERELGIPALLDPEDMAAMMIPDKLSIMTYVSQYYNHFKDKKPAAKDGKEEKSSKGSKLNSIRRSMRKSKDRDKDKAKEDGASPRKKATMGDKCKVCGKHVYMIERQVVDGKLFHRACFKCDKCFTTLRPGSYKTTKDPKKFECVHHGKDVFKIRSNMASRSAGSRLAGADDDDSAIWRVQRSASVANKPTTRPPQPPVAAAAPVKHEASPPARPVIKPPPAPSPTPDPSAAIPLHPHLLAAASARSQFLSGATPQEQNIRPLSRETCIDDVIEGSTIPTNKSSKEANSPVRQKLVRQNKMEESVDTDLNQNQDTTGDSISMKSATSDSASTASKEGLTTSQDSLLKNIDSTVSSKVRSKDENMNAEKSDEEKEVIAAITRKQDVSIVKVGDDMKGMEEKKEEEMHKNNKDLSQLEEKKDEKWESERVKENVDDLEIVEKDEAGSVDNKEAEIRQDSPELIVNEKPQMVDEDNSLNPFGDDEDDEGESEKLSNEAKPDVTLQITLEERQNKKNEEDIASEDIKPNDSGSIASGDTTASSKPDDDVQGAGHVEVARLAVQSKALDSDAKSASSIDDAYDNDYDNELNPFADEDDEVVADDYKKEYNPFDESGSEENNEEEYDSSLNPFGDDDAEMDDSQTTPNGAYNPFTGSLLKPSKSGKKPDRPPPPRATQDQSSMYQVKTRQQVLQEMHVSRDTIRQSKKKRPAPRRPPPPGVQGTPSPSKDGAVVPPRRRKTKTRKAPPPPPTQDGSPKKTAPQRPPPITVSPSPENAPSDKPVPSPRLSLLGENSGNSSPDQSPPTRPRLVITPDVGGSSDGEDRPRFSPRKNRRATTCGVLAPKTKSISPNRLSMSKRKAPLPPAIKRDVTKDHEDPHKIQTQLTDNEKQQRELEQRGITLENKLRQTMEEASEGDQESEEVLLEWFKLVNDRNKLIRKEGEFIAQLQMQELEVEHADIEYQLRVIMNKQDHERVDADTEQEEKLLEMLVDVVTRRANVIDRLEVDRIREEEEDENIRAMMAESGLSKETHEKEGKKKKGHKKKKDKTIWHVR